MAYKQISPMVVAEGGTGLSSITDHGILLGSGVGAITPLGVATNGQIPIGSTGADMVLATITGNNGITVTNAAGAITLAGKVVQIVSSNNLAGSSTTSATAVDVTGATLSITPTSASNNILVLFNWLTEVTNSSSVNTFMYYNIFRDAVQISTVDVIYVSGISGVAGDQHNGQNTYSYIDSPATTSATAYSLKHHRIMSSGSTTLTTSEISIVLMEIA